MKAAAKITLIVAVLAVVTLSLAVLSVPRFMMAMPRSSVLRAQTARSISDVAMARTQVASLQPHLERIKVVDSVQVFGPWSSNDPLQGPDGDRLVMGGTFTLREDETLDGNLVVLGGMATLEEDSTVAGDVVVMGGTVRADGTIEGEVVAIGGLVELGDSAVVEGDVSSFGGHIETSDGAVIEGSFNADMPFPVVIPGTVRVPTPSFEGPEMFNVGVNPVWKAMWNAMWVLLRSFMWAVVAVLVVLFLPDHTERVTHTVVTQPVISGGLGLLTAVVAPLLLVIIALTIIGIPVSLVGLFVLMVAWAYGLIAVGMEVGKRMAQMLDQEWALPVAAGVGVFTLTLVVNGLDALVPCFGWVFPALVGMVGLGAVILTRFGLQYYPTDELTAPAAPAAPAATAVSAPLEIPAAVDDENGPPEDE